MSAARSNFDSERADGLRAPIRLSVLSAWIASTALVLWILDLVQDWTQGEIYDRESFEALLLITGTSSAPWIVAAPVIAWIARRFHVVPRLDARFVIVHLIAGSLVAASVLGIAVKMRPAIHRAHFQIFRLQLERVMDEWHGTIETTMESAGELGVSFEVPTDFGQLVEAELDSLIPHELGELETSHSILVSSGVPPFADSLFEPGELDDAFGVQETEANLPIFLGAFLTYATLLILTQTLIVGREYGHVRASEAELRSRHDRMQLDSLRSRVDPHFLYNVLAGISATVPSDPEGARTMIADLSDLMRDSASAKTSFVSTLGAEITLLSRYTNLIERRFGDRFAVQVEVADELRAALVPSWSLQPLVENVVVHGVERTTQRVTVRITAAIEDDVLTLSVVDDAPISENSASLGTGTATRNLAQKIETLCGVDARLELGPEEGRGWRSELRLPQAPLRERRA